MAGNLWKPGGENTGKLVVLFERSPGEVVIKDANTGAVLEVGYSTGPSNGRADTIRFQKHGSGYQNVIVETSSGESFFIGNGGDRYDNISLSPPGATPTETLGVQSPGGMSNIPGIPGIGNVASPVLLDPNLVKEFPVEFKPIEAAEYDFTDPLETAKQTGDFNREQIDIAFKNALARGETLSKADIAQQIYYLNQLTPVQRELMSIENAFNQQQRQQAAETAVPGITDTLRGRVDRAETLSQGKLLSTAEDRALELTARSVAADEAFTRGFGDDSIAGRATGDLMSAKERLNVMQVGESFMNNAIAQATGVLMDTPQKASMASQIPASPRVPMSQITTSQQAAELQLTTMSPTASQQSIVQQEQFQTNLDQRVNEINQAGEMSAQVYNSGMAWQANMAKLGIIAGNVAATNTFQQAALNDNLATQEQTNLDSRLNQALANFEKNRDRAQLLSSVASIFGGKNNIPRKIIDGLVDKVGNFVFSWLAGDDEDSGISFDAGLEDEDVDVSVSSDNEIVIDTDTGTGIDVDDVSDDSFVDADGNVNIPDFEYNPDEETYRYSLNTTYTFRLDPDSTEFEGMI